MVSVDDLVAYVSGSDGWPMIRSSFEGLLEKLRERDKDSDSQLVAIDYWIGLLFLMRSFIQNRTKSA